MGEACSTAEARTRQQSLPSQPCLQGIIAGVTFETCSKEPVTVPRGAPEALRSLRPREEGAGSLMTCGFLVWKTFVRARAREKERECLLQQVL